MKDTVELESSRENISTQIDQDTEELIDDANEEYLYENSNKNSILNSTKRDYIAGIVSKDMCRRKLLPPDIVERTSQESYTYTMKTTSYSVCTTAVLSISMICCKWHCNQ